MTTDLALGARTGRHHVAGSGSGPVPASQDEHALAGWAAALAMVGPDSLAAWPAPLRREYALVRAHLAPIRSRQALAASFARESFRRSATPESRPARTLLASPVLAAYASRWLELPDR